MLAPPLQMSRLIQVAVALPALPVQEDIIVVVEGTVVPPAPEVAMGVLTAVIPRPLVQTMMEGKGLPVICILRTILH